MKKLKVVHLDDHELLVRSVKSIMIESRPDIEFEYFDFRDTGSAFEFVSSAMKNDSAPDMIITDFNHIGPDGYKFGEMIRDLEKRIKRTPTPILLLTLVSSSRPIIQKGLKEKLFNSYVSLGDMDATNKISDFIDNNRIAIKNF